MFEVYDPCIVWVYDHTYIPSRSDWAARYYYLLPDMFGTFSHKWTLYDTPHNKLWSNLVYEHTPSFRHYLETIRAVCLSTNCKYTQLVWNDDVSGLHPMWEWLYTHVPVILHSNMCNIDNIGYTCVLALLCQFAWYFFVLHFLLLLSSASLSINILVHRQYMQRCQGPKKLMSDYNVN